MATRNEKEQYFHIKENLIDYIVYLGNIDHKEIVNRGYLPIYTSQLDRQGNWNNYAFDIERYVKDRTDDNLLFHFMKVFTTTIIFNLILLYIFKEFLR